ncbi:hypothetical protein I316_02931 [Kwoniella heveanensis BCC8398]|uniref:Trafficking protein particle complex subunit n=1 Tax=Kwoniella heveanensis BCC8398 TaxID=1296120 RepID=A0A1B9GWI6_9TREE|nr:hypothetical protein I316_02931 [Kwoniella heveanensis BCC8398]
MFKTKYLTLPFSLPLTLSAAHSAQTGAPPTDMITLNEPPLTQHISVPRDMSQLSCEAYTAGLVEGVLDGLDVPARVTAHTVGSDRWPQRTVILIKLDQKIIDREEALGK